MNLKVGIVGLPNVGKSTLFRALTRKPVHIANYPFATIDPNVGVVGVPDERLTELAALSRSAKTISAAIEFVDIAGLVEGAHEGMGLGNAFLSHIRDVDLILHVVRVFSNPDIIHVSPAPDPIEDFKIILLELIFKDLETAAKALEEAESGAKSGDAKKIERRDALRVIKDQLNAESLLSAKVLSETETRIVRELGLITAKPMVAVFNISDTELAEDWSPDEELRKAVGASKYLAIPIGIEDEARSLPDSEAADFYELAGISHSYLDDLIRMCYSRLRLISFFTTGEDETRAWTIPDGSIAPRAGRAIHSDFEEKFIRAEVIAYEKLIEAGSIARARELGWLRVEGREYVVQDGDVIEFKI